MAIAFVCVNYNGFHHTEKMIKSLLDQSGKESEFSIYLIVVDNSPTVKQELVELCNTLPEVAYLRSENNEGYFSGLNLGIKKLDLTEYEYVIPCNNDLEFESDFCSQLVKMEFDERTQVLCPDVITIDGVHQNPHHLKALSRQEILAFDCYFSHYYFALFLLRLKSWWQALRPRKITSSDSYPDSLEINQGVGACYILTKNFFKKHSELFFPEFLYGEEAALSWQVRCSGGCLVYRKKLKVIHAESATLSQLPARQTYEFGKKSYWVIRKYLF